MNSGQFLDYPKFPKLVCMYIIIYTIYVLYLSIHIY